MLPLESLDLRSLIVVPFRDLQILHAGQACVSNRTRGENSAIDHPT
eukprot:COSAG02_NODE_23_length_52893_cov_58.101868_42_plen_46_part_00